MKIMGVIGRAERAEFPDLGTVEVPAKIDTGADTSSIWAKAHKSHKDDYLHVVFFDRGSEYYTGKEYVYTPQEYTVTRVANSFGQREIRYKVKLRIKLRHRVIKGTFTLSDRSKKLYPVLIGRSLLNRKFYVDVSKGSPLIDEENERAEQLNEELIKLRED